VSIFKQTATTGGGDYEKAPEGNHPAVLVGLIDLGTHEDEYQGTISSNRKVFLVWELVAEPLGKEGSSNHTIGRDYNVSFGPKAGLRLLIEKWRGKALGDGEEFDLTKLLGQKCLVQIVHKTSAKGSVYAKVEGVSGLPKGMAIPPAKVKPVAWGLDDDDAGDPPDGAWLPYVRGKKVSDMIAESEERSGAGAGAGDADEETVGGDNPF
jgi:hypothetical protein